MMELFFLAWLAYTALLSWVAWRRLLPPLLTPLGTLIGLWGYFVLMVLTVSHGFALTSFAMMPFASLVLPFLIRCVEVWFSAVHRWAHGVDAMKPVRTYDLAEKAEREQDLDEAIRCYRDVYAVRDPTDPVPHLRLGELWIRRGDRAQGVAALRRGAELSDNIEQTLIAAFRAAEFMSDPAPYLASLRERATDARHRTLLENRIETLRAK